MNEGLDWAKIIAQIVAGGPMYWIAGGVAIVLGIVLLLWWKKVQRDLADKASQEKGEKDQAGTLPANQDPSKEWEEAGKRVDEKRKQAREQFKHPPSDSGTPAP